MFADQPESPFSIHRFVQRGAESCGKYPGEWFGPSATARCIQYVPYRLIPDLQEDVLKLTGCYRANANHLSSEST